MTSPVLAIHTQNVLVSY